ncbi:MAG: hypothetical protein [Bacteriophage sp.]|nr:MAG: hypothetical protein [Bacteriophage sp.]
MEKISKYPYLGKFSFLNNEEMAYVVLFNRPKTGMIVSSNIVGNTLLEIGSYSEEWDENSFTYLPKEIDVRLNND